MVFNRTENTGRNAVWGLLQQALLLLLPFIVRTILIRKLGTEYVGLSSLFSSVIQMLNLTELGFSTAVVHSLYKPIAENDTDQIRSLLSFYRKAYRIIGTVILALGLVLLPFLNLLINGDVPDGINIYVLYIIYLLNTSISYFLFTYKECLITAHQRNDLSSKINIISKIVLYGGQIVVLLVTQNYYLYILMLLISTILNSILIQLISKRYYPEYYCSGQLSENIKGSLKKQVSGLMITKVAATTRNSFDNIIVSSFIGLTAVGIYGNYYYVISSVQGILLILTQSMQAAIGNCVATEGVEKNFNDFRKFQFMYFWLAGFCAVCILFFYQPFMIAWTGSDNLLEVSHVVLLVIYFYLLTLGDIPSLYVNATGIWWDYRSKSIMEAVSNLVLNVVLVRFWGLLGVIAATVLTRLIFGIIQGNSILFRKYFNTKQMITYYKDIILYTLLLTCCIVILGLLYNLMGIGFLTLTIPKFLICIIAPNVLFLVVFCRSKLFRESFVYVKRILTIVKSHIRR